MKKIIAAAALALTATGATAQDLNLDCSYTNLRNNITVEQIIIGQSFAGRITSNGVDIGPITQTQSLYQFTLETIVSRSTYSISKDLSTFRLNHETVIDGEVISSNSFSGQCKKTG